MRHKKYDQKKKIDRRIDRSTIWQVYHSDSYENEVVLKFQQLGGERATLSINYDKNDQSFNVYINGIYEHSWNQDEEINNVISIITMINIISSDLQDENIIRGKLGAGIFDNGSFRNNPEAMYFCTKCLCG